MLTNIFKKSLLFILLFYFFSISTIWANTLCTNVSGEQNINVYRLYFEKTKEHLYTADPAEVNYLKNQVGWNYEGIGWYSPTEGNPVYRLNNPKLGSHLYTIDENEVRELTKTTDWQLDFNGSPLFYSGGILPIYRLYNKNLKGTHHLTIDTNEKETLVRNGWQDEGIALYGTTVPDGEFYPIQPNDISTIPSEYSIQADVQLNGSGSGFHAKLVGVTPTSGISFGIQYDAFAIEKYRNKTAFLVENIYDNNPGGQQYLRTGYALLNRTFRLLLAIQKDGTCSFYVNGNKVGQVFNPNLTNQHLDLRVEGSGRINGDKLDALFTNIKVKNNGIFDESHIWNVGEIVTNRGLMVNRVNFPYNQSIEVFGSIIGLSDSGNWDSEYNGVSGIGQFY